MENLEFIIEDAERRAEVGKNMTDKSELKTLYHTAQKIAPGNALDYIRNAKTDEERNFYAYIADMNLQREQKKAIERNSF